jgi:hypothetical protein
VSLDARGILALFVERLIDSALQVIELLQGHKLSHRDFDPCVPQCAGHIQHGLG